ncbi:hypothetical protein ACIQKE_00640 [Streptomyces griseoviridis]
MSTEALDTTTPDGPPVFHVFAALAGALGSLAEFRVEQSHALLFVNDSAFGVLEASPM